MRHFAENGVYHISEEMKKELEDFYGNFATEEESASQIKKIYEDTGYVMDTHTAVASAVYEKYKKDTGDKTKTVIASTASPFKFTRSVMCAIDSKYENMEDFKLVDELSRISNVPVPAAIEEIRTAPVRHQCQCGKEEMKKVVEDFLGL